MADTSSRSLDIDIGRSADQHAAQHNLIVRCFSSVDFNPTVDKGSNWDSVELIPCDPILGLAASAQACTHPNKLNLCVGAYRTEEGKPYVLNAVRKAEHAILSRNENKEYLPSEGLSAFRKGSVELLLGGCSSLYNDGRVACIQTVSGTGALRVGAAFIARVLKATRVYISDPSWFNHQNIFADERLEVKFYRYFDPATRGLDMSGMMEDLAAAPDHSVVLLQGCAHNPTGVDPSALQWQKIADLCKKKQLLPFFDVAYQGFATGDMRADAFAPRLFAAMGIEFMVAMSFSKNMGLYGERVGSLIVTSKTAKGAQSVGSQLTRIARTIYSTPPLQGARIAAEVMHNKQLMAEWERELQAMADRISTVRSTLQRALELKCPDRDWSFVSRQIGMFSYTGLRKEQVEHMINKHHVYMTMDGRISLAGLCLEKCEYLADALIDSMAITA